MQTNSTSSQKLKASFFDFMKNKWGMAVSAGLLFSLIVSLGGVSPTTSFLAGFASTVAVGTIPRVRTFLSSAISKAYGAVGYVFSRSSSKKPASVAVPTSPEKTIEQLTADLKAVQHNIQSQKTSISVCTRGIIPPYMGEAILESYKAEEAELKRKIEARQQGSSKAPKLGKSWCQIQ